MKILKYLGSNRKLLISLATRHYLVCDNTKRNYCIGEDQKTYMDVLNQPGRGPLMIDTYSSYGFRLNSGLFVVGPVILFPSTVISWNVANDEDISEESLSVFSKIEPKLDIVLIGISGKANESTSHINRIYEVLNSFKVNCEVLQTDRACPTYNYLNAEGRYMAAALIPPLSLVMDDNDLAQQFNRLKVQMKDDYLLYTDLPLDKMFKSPDPKSKKPRLEQSKTNNTEN